ncbi:MAG: hypothetical protein F4X97_15210 [Boseongicola sp. SB0662_bin_57]|nr:hypothetical protein [Boseongicola sp. SB0662_bin_57]
MADSAPGGSHHHDRSQAALDITDRATDMALSCFHGGDRFRAMSKKAKMDLVTKADQEIDRFIKAELARHAPEDGFLGEESGSGEGEALWVVDPPGGTAGLSGRVAVLGGVDRACRGGFAGRRGNLSGVSLGCCRSRADPRGRRCC